MHETKSKRGACFENLLIHAQGTINHAHYLVIKLSLQVPIFKAIYQLFLWNKDFVV